MTDTDAAAGEARRRVIQALADLEMSTLDELCPQGFPFATRDECHAAGLGFYERTTGEMTPPPTPHPAGEEG